MFRFGWAVVDVARRVVEVAGEPRHLEPQAFDLLAYLIAERDRVVSKEELLDEVWGDQFVSESALTTRIKEIRRALDDDGVRQGVVKNFRGRGYRFVAELEGQSAPRARRLSTTDLVGRDRDLTEVMDLLANSRLVTLVGPGGVGKTALAQAVAAREAEHLRDGIVFVSLAAVQEPGDVIHELRRDADLEGADPAEETILASLADLDALIVVDNCEHVIDEAARLVGDIARRPGRARIVATSRERLAIPGEQVWRVEPLDDTAARDLLVARTCAVHPGFELAPGDEAPLERLLTMLDRLPLAIEMAAARLSAMGVGELVEHLTRRIDLMSSPHRGVADRQRTLPALVRWSEDLLEPEARELLWDLSVFAGPVAAVDIAAVVGADESELVLGPLTALAEQSLVVVDPAGPHTRYRLLETVRSIVSARRNPQVDERHARFVARLVNDADGRLRTPEEGKAAARIDEVVAEVRDAHHWASGHDLRLAADLSTSLLHYAHERQWAEPAQWSARLADRLNAGGEPFAAAVAADASNRGDYERAKRLAERALAASDPRVVACAHDTLANVGVYTGDLDLAGRHSTMLLDLGKRTEDATAWTLGLINVVLAHLYGGSVDEAQRALSELERPPVMSPTCSAWMEYTAGEVMSAAGREREAIKHFDRALALGESVDSRFVVSVARVSALAARSRAGDVDEAMAAFSSVLAGYRRTRSLTHATTALRNLIGLMVRAERDEPAMVLLGALAGPEVKSTYGAEFELLANARSTVEQRRGVDRVAAWAAEGGGHDVVWALDHAIAALEAV